VSRWWRWSRRTAWLQSALEKKQKEGFFDVLLLFFCLLMLLIPYLVACISSFQPSPQQCSNGTTSCRRRHNSNGKMSCHRRVIATEATARQVVDNSKKHAT
jgi:hypothetical protein